MGKLSEKITCGCASCDLCAWMDDLAASQVQLDPDAERALRANLWDLYDDCATVEKTARAIARQDAVFAEL